MEISDSLVYFVKRTLNAARRTENGVALVSIHKERRCLAVSLEISYRIEASTILKD
jgi:hypothetical protein